MKEQIEKQAIEEIAKVIERTEQIARDAHCGLPSPTMYAKDLYWHDYRKQSEGEWLPSDVLRGDEDWKRYACSLCKHMTDAYYRYARDISKFCPNCGAKMKGGAG